YSSYGYHRDLHSFPTRRSSDLGSFGQVGLSHADGILADSRNTVIKRPCDQGLVEFSQTIERPQSVYAPQGRRALFKEPNKRRNGIIVMAHHQKALGCPAPPNVRAGQLSYKFCGRRLAESNVFGQGQRRLCLRDDPVDSAAVLSVI